MPSALRRSVRLGTAVLGLVLVGLLGVSGAQGSPACSQSGPLVCLSVTATPQTVSPSLPDSPRYVSYHADVSNQAANTVNHVTFAGTLPGGSSLVSVTPSVGSCAPSGIACDLGGLRSGASVSVDVVGTAPATTGPATASFSVSFDEGPNDNGSSDPKQDTVTTSETVDVRETAGTASSFVPEGASVDLSTDPTGSGVASSSDPLLADAAIDTAPTSLTALLEETPGPLTCPKGVVCRGGDWVHADIPGTFDPPLSFGLRWDKTLIPSSLNSKKFAFLVTECLGGCPINVVSRRCSSATPASSELPCLWNVAKKPDGDWVGTLINSHNGYMR